MNEKIEAFIINLLFGTSLSVIAYGLYTYPEHVFIMAGIFLGISLFAILLMFLINFILKKAK